MTILAIGVTGNVGTGTRTQLTLARAALSICAWVHGGMLLTRVNRWWG